MDKMKQILFDFFFQNKRIDVLIRAIQKFSERVLVFYS